MHEKTHMFKKRNGNLAQIRFVSEVFWRKKHLQAHITKILT